jgi:hypothetical protein
MGNAPLSICQIVNNDAVMSDLPRSSQRFYIQSF